MTIHNIALVGFMRAGKDSVADCLRHLYHEAEKISFADALKQEVADALNRTRQESDPVYTVEFFNEDRNRPVFRPLLQWWGTEYRRNQDPDYWVRQVEKKTLAYDQICTDARFTNELTMLAKHGFYIVHLDMAVEEVQDYLFRQGLTREQVSQQLSHPSEREWQGFPKDLRLRSQFGNLLLLTTQVVAFLNGTAPDEATVKKIEAFYAARYPTVYGSRRKEQTSGG